MDKKKLADDLTELFIGYQYRLDHPMLMPNELQKAMFIKYQTNSIFKAKVQVLVAGVMYVVSNNLNKELDNEL